MSENKKECKPGDRVSCVHSYVHMEPLFGTVVRQSSEPNHGGHTDYDVKMDDFDQFIKLFPAYTDRRDGLIPWSSQYLTLVAPRLPNIKRKGKWF